VSETNNLPKVAVCLAAYNGMQWLDQQIETIKKQKGVDVTLYISVDLSSDGTDEYVHSIAETTDRVIFLPYGERFGGAARNFFRLISDIDFSSYQYVALADQDDIWHEKKLSQAITTLDIANADGYSSNVTAFWEDGRQTLINKAQPQREWDFLFEAAGPGCTYVFRSSLANRVKNCLLENSELAKDVGLHDWFIYAFARANGFKWIIDPNPSMLYRQHSTNQVGVNEGIRAFVFRAKKVLSGWGLQQAYLIARIIGLESNDFILRWHRMRRKDLIWLSLNSGKCRRRGRDRVLFCFSCLGMAILSRVR
jgi:rhamnosyltransferase